MSDVAGELRVEPIRIGDTARDAGYFRFRTEHFGHRLGWDVLNREGVDRDDIDEHSSHFGLFDEDEVVGCIRVTGPSAPHWMIDLQPFAGLIDPALDPKYPRQQALEISRLGVLPSSRIDGKAAARALRRAAYQHSINAGYRYWYVVAYRALIEGLRRYDHLPFRSIGATVRLDAQGKTSVACLDLADAHAAMGKAAPELLTFNNDGLSSGRLKAVLDLQ